MTVPQAMNQVEISNASQSSDRRQTSIPAIAQKPSVVAILMVSKKR
jgi:hypothetical protein